MSSAIALPAWVVANLWEWEGHGPPHPIVGHDEYWTPPEVRERFRATVMATLGEDGLADDGVLVDELRDALWVLANAVPARGRTVRNGITGSVGGTPAIPRPGRS